MFKETKVYYERFTFTTIELSVLFTNITSSSNKLTFDAFDRKIASNDLIERSNESYYRNGSIEQQQQQEQEPYNTVLFEYEVRDSLWIVVPISVIYVAIFLIGVLGNVITCAVISRNKSMHTATNYYLFSLAISDLLLLLSGVPQEIYFVWYRFPYPFDNCMCMLQGFAAETSANATVLTITAFTVERYFAICKPFISHTMSKLSRAIRLILAIWMIAMCLAIPQAMALQIDEEFSTCTVRRDQQQHVFTLSTVIVFVFPMCVLTILYILIGLQLHRSKVWIRRTKQGSSVRLKQSIFKRNSQQTIVSVNYQQDSPQHYSETMLTSAMQLPPEQPQLSLRIGNNDSSRRDTASTATNSGRRVCSRVKRTNSAQSADGRINYSNKAQYHSSRRVVKMLVAVVIAFFLCWAPFHAQRLFAVYGNDQNHNEAIRKAYEILTYISGILYFVSTCINPVLYNIMSHRFRQAFKECLIALRF
ncbi:pyrokinin-1 receptor-like [Sabethes cyaneus]|uniref:pyrokinin-1 receptor-like n=1 Tax=Sabethes cyaneus TaxID=53552 RepID=UPI00237E613D|nr:pyrokinin-1 receptor-like [Sabethes cyaneus]